MIVNIVALKNKFIHFSIKLLSTKFIQKIKKEQNKEQIVKFLFILV